MNTKERATFREAILRVLDANHTRFGLGAPAIALQIESFGFDVTAAQVAEQLTYLKKKGLVQEVGKSHSPEIVNWELTGDGADHVAMREAE